MINDKNSITIFAILICLFIIFIFGLTFYQQKSTDTSTELSSLDLTSPQKKSTTTEPVVTDWQTYNNEEFNFSISVPAKWNIKDYKAAYFAGGTLIAFSPDELPCETCSYFNNGFFSIKIYNNVSDPAYFEGYIERVKQIGKNKQYQLVQVGNYRALAFANTISLENKGWVYELSLDINDGKSDIKNSPIFQKAAGSIQFNTLQFNQ